MTKPLLIIQFETIIHPSPAGSTTRLTGPANPGALQFLEWAATRYQIELLSPRLQKPMGAAEIWEWLREAAHAEFNNWQRAISLARNIGYTRAIPSTAILLTRHACRFDGSWPLDCELQVALRNTATPEPPRKPLWRRALDTMLVR